MIKKFLRRQKYRKMIKGSSSFILEDFALIVFDTIDFFEKKGGQIKDDKKELLKYESTILLFWLFQKIDVFPEPWHKLILDEIHNQYHDNLRKEGYDYKSRKMVEDDMNLMYETYNNVFREYQDFSKVAVKFVSILAKRTKTDLDKDDLEIPLYLYEKVRPKFNEYRAMIKDSP